MATIIWKNSAELADLSELFFARQDFTIHGFVEKINKEATAIKVRLFEKNKKWHGVWFNITEDFDLDALGENTAEATLLTFTCKIETYFSNEKFLMTKVTLTNWAEADSEPESSLLLLEDMTFTGLLETDKKNLVLMTFERVNEKGKEQYHLRFTNTPNTDQPKVTADLAFKLGITKHQIKDDGVRKVGFESYSYEKDGETIQGTRVVYRLCLNLEQITWK